MKARHKFWIIAIVITVGIVGLSMLFVDVIPPHSLTHLSMHMCKRRIQRYAASNNALPSSLSQTKEIAGHDNSIKDAWGREIIYTADANGLVTLASLGKDNKPGGTGDNTDMIGIYPSRQENGRWSNEFVDWTQDPFDELKKQFAEQN